MKSLIIEEILNEIPGKIKKQFTNLIDNNSLYQGGKSKEILERLRTKLGKTKRKIRSDKYPSDFRSVHSVRTEQKIFLQIFLEEFKFKR